MHADNALLSLATSGVSCAGPLSRVNALNGVLHQLREKKVDVTVFDLHETLQHRLDATTFDGRDL